MSCPVLQDTETFCRETLCNPAVSVSLSESCIPYTFARRSRRVAELCRQLGPTSFPYCAFLQPTSAHAHASFSLIGAQEGPCSPEELLDKVQAALTEMQHTLDAAQRRQHSLARERSVREQQDAELAASMEMDQARAAEREAQAAREHAAQVHEEQKAEAERFGSFSLIGSTSLLIVKCTCVCFVRGCLQYVHNKQDAVHPHLETASWSHY
jgi:hypothetical protein